MIKDIRNHDKLTNRANNRTKRWERWLLKKQLLSAINKQLEPKRQELEQARKLIGTS